MSCGTYYTSRELLSYSEDSEDKFTVCPVCQHHTYLRDNPVPEEIDV